MEDKALTSILNIINYDEGEIILFDYSAYDIYCKYETLFNELKKEIQSNLKIIKEDKLEYLNSFNKNLFIYYSSDKHIKSKHFKNLNPLSGEITIDASLYSIIKMELFLSGYKSDDDKIYEEQYEFIEFVKNYYLMDLNSFIKDLIKKISKAVSAKNIFSANTNLDLHNNEKIKWSGKKTHIGFVLGTLALKGFIDAPKHKNGEINFAAFSRLILENFDVDIDKESLRKYLNPEEQKFNENFNAFTKANFNIPNIIEVS